MIYILTTRDHTFTHRQVVKALRQVETIPYETAFSRSYLPFGTYIFTDFDRLGHHELELAADLYRLLEKAGCKVLNDPACALHRYALLKRMHSLGINDFLAWRADEGILPDRSPVFLRTQASHRGTLTDLLYTQEQTQKALDQAIEDGYPLDDLMFVEYRAEEVDGVFWKHSVYRVDDLYFAGPCVIDRSWVSKQGIKGLATPEQFRTEHALVIEGTYVDVLKSAFEAGNIRYGRADFGIVRGRIAVYEINTNPSMKLEIEHHSPIRLAMMKHVRETYLNAVADLDRPNENRQSVRVRSQRFPSRSLGKRLQRFLRKRYRLGAANNRADGSNSAGVRTVDTEGR